MPVNVSIDTLVELRKTLHANPEASLKEVKTREILKNFLKDHTKNTKIVDMGSWFYALHEEEGATETIAFRADHDAIVSENGQAFHGCGHDGHSTILAGLAWNLDDKKVGKNIVFLFQHAEENGAGAAEVVKAFDDLAIDRVYGMHNWPGYELGKAYSLVGTIYFASKGLEIQFSGRQSHASEPEKGINPSFAISEFIQEFAPLSQFDGYHGRDYLGHAYSDLILGTLVSTKVGEPGAYGVSPSKGQVQMTIRAAKLDDLDHLTQALLNKAEEIAKKYGLTVSHSTSDEFPDTTNSQEEFDRVQEIFKAHGRDLYTMEEPIRSSEDFGWYQKKVPGLFFLVGSGVDHAAVHQTNYEFPDEIIEEGIAYFTWIAEA